MEIEYKLRELLMPVLGIANIEEIQPSHAQATTRSRTSTLMKSLPY